MCQKLEECISVLFDEHNGNYGYSRIHLELRNEVKGEVTSPLCYIYVQQ